MTNVELTQIIEDKLTSARGILAKLRAALKKENENDSNSLRFETLYKLTRDQQKYINDLEWTRNFWNNGEK